MCSSDLSAIIYGVGHAADNGCWNIVSYGAVHRFGNQYYSKGNVTHNLNLTDTVEGFVSAETPYVALKIPATTGYLGAGGNPELVGFETLADMVEAQQDLAFAIKPLYKFDANGAVAVDFRNCPEFQATEIVP